MNFNELINIILQNIPAIGAGAATLYIIVKSINDYATQNSKSFLVRLRYVAIPIVFFLALIGVFAAIYLKWQPKTEWVVWQENVGHFFNGCRLNGKELVDTKAYIPDFDRPDRTRISSSNDLEFQCLALALKKFPRPEKHIDIEFRPGRGSPTNDRRYTEAFWRDLQAIQLLYRIPGVQSTLSDALSLYPESFLGTGFTFPHQEAQPAQGSRAYFQTGIREYLVKNLCVAEDAVNCPGGRTTRYNNLVWVWKYSPADLMSKFRDKRMYEILETLGEPDRILNGAKRVETFKNSRPRLMAFGNRDNDRYGSVLIRIAKFPQQNYSHTLGHPLRRFAFFSDIRDVWNLKWDQLVSLSGAAGGNDTPDTRVFIFIILIEQEAKAIANPATWGYVFDILDAAVEDVGYELKAKSGYVSK